MASGGGTGLTQQQLARALRYFVITGLLWGMYSYNASPAGPVLSGFCLRQGMTDAQVAFLVALAGLMGASQILSFLLITRRARNKRRMLVGIGSNEISFTSSIILAGLLLPAHSRFYAVAALLATGLFFGNAANPAWNTWFSNVVPPEGRSAYIGRRLFIITGVNVAYLFVASHLLDVIQYPLNFILIYAGGWLSGVAGYVVTALTPYPHVEEQAQTPVRGILRPFRERPYLRLCLFLMAWSTAVMVAGAFYSLYMLRYLKLSYSMVALYTNLSMLCTMGGYRLWGTVSQKFGNRPVLQLLVVPSALVPLLWTFSSAHTYQVLIPLAMVVGGLATSGVSVTLSSLLYKTVPQGRNVPEYFVVWNLFNTLGAGAGPLIAGLLRRSLGASTASLFGLQLTSVQVIFAASSAAMLVPVLLSFFLEESEVSTPAHVLGQFRGNLLSLAYNLLLYGTSREDEHRADRLRALGRSHSPLAADALLRGLTDSSPAVRAAAAEGLGESGLDEGLAPLANTLTDEESDLRDIAAQALGKLRRPEGVGPLIDALRSDDPRLRTSAAQALGEIGGDEAREALVEALQQPFDRQVFASLADALSRTGDLRVIEPAFEQLAALRSPVLRMQVLNAVGRVIGEKNHFYRLRVTEGLSRAVLIEKMLARVVRLLRSVKLGAAEQRQELIRLASEAATAVGRDDPRELRPLAETLASAAIEVEGGMPLAYAAARSIKLYLASEDGSHPDEALVFLTVCLTSMARHLALRPRPGR